jgi:hypothetical protein
VRGRRQDRLPRGDSVLPVAYFFGKNNRIRASGRENSEKKLFFYA